MSVLQDKVFDDKQVEVRSVTSCLNSLRVYADSVAVIADSDGNSSGAITCDAFSSITLMSNSHFDVCASDVGLLCNVSGAGDMSLSCDYGQEMSLGSSENTHSLATFHLSNSELDLIDTSGTLVIGSESVHNVSNIWIDGLVFAPHASHVIIATSAGSLVVTNSSSSATLANDASMFVKASKNVSVETNLTVTAYGNNSTVLFATDTNCSIDADGSTPDAHFVVGSSGSLVVDTTSAQLFIETPRLDLSGFVNATYAKSLTIQGERFSFFTAPACTEFQ